MSDLRGLTLHQMQMSGNCHKVRLVAHQLGIALTLKDYPLHGSETRAADFLAKNPDGRVPLLEFPDGRCLTESGVILFHLTEGTPLRPGDAWHRAQTLQWMFFEQYSHEPYIAVVHFWLSYAPKEQLETKKHLVPEWHAKGNAALGVMETHLRQGDWFAGPHYTIADIALYGYTHSAKEGDFDLSRYPAIRRWLCRSKRRPALFLWISDSDNPQPDGASHAKAQTGQKRAGSLRHWSWLHGNELRLRPATAPERYDRPDPQGGGARRHFFRHRRNLWALCQ
jgi:glutathione S-transferase